MELSVRPYRREDEGRVLEICLSAFEPVHAGFEAALGPALFRQHYPDWRGAYARQVAGWPPEAPGEAVHVAELDGGGIVAFALTRVDAGSGIGVLDLNAVMPGHQGKGIGRAFYRALLEDLRRRGARSAYVGTGGDAAHEAARRAYAAAGFDRVIPALHLHREL